MNQYHRIRCPICSASIEIDEVPDNCPACKEYIKDKIKNLDGTGITTATVTGPGLSPLSDTIQDVH